MNYRSIFTATAFAVAFSASAAVAAPLVPVDGNDGSPDLFEAFNLLTGFNATGNADLVPYRIDDSFDIKFEMSGADTPWVGLTAAQTNEFGYVDEFGTEFGTGVATNGFGFTGDGSAADPFLGATFNPDPTGSVVTFFLRSNGWLGSNTFYSDPNKNPGMLDHMIAYSLKSFGPISVFANFGGVVREVVFKNPVLIGWEDIVGGGDQDYDDAMFLIDATPVPIPAAGLLLLGGLGGLVALKRRKNA